MERGLGAGSVGDDPEGWTLGSSRWFLRRLFGKKDFGIIPVLLGELWDHSSVVLSRSLWDGGLWDHSSVVLSRSLGVKSFGIIPMLLEGLWGHGGRT